MYNMPKPMQSVIKIVSAISLLLILKQDNLSRTEILLLSRFCQHQHILITIAHIYALFKPLDLMSGTTPLHWFWYILYF